MKQPLSILICDDHQIVRMGLKIVIQLHDDLRIVGEAVNGEEAVRLAVSLKPDVVVMDLMMPKLNGAEATRKIVNGPGVPRVLILTTFGTGPEIREALSAGASGAILKDTPHTHIINAIRKVAAGERILGEGISLSKDNAPTLTDRQRKVLQLIGEGFTTKAIADRLDLTSDGVNRHLRAIFAKLNVASRSEAVAIALRKNLM